MSSMGEMLRSMYVCSVIGMSEWSPGVGERSLDPDGWAGKRGGGREAAQVFVATAAKGTNARMQKKEGNLEWIRIPQNRIGTSELRQSWQANRER
jgi:hypothetical protein